MIKTPGRIILLVSILAIVALPLFASAQSYSPPNLWPDGYWAQNGLITCTGSFLGSGSGSGNSANLPTCTSLCDLLDTFINIIYFAISICFFILAPLFFAVGG